MKEQVMIVQGMQDYIEEHLTEELKLGTLARNLYISPWYAHRLFKEYTGYTPAEYIRRLRLSRSALKLRNENCKISDIAFEMGFGSVDGYTRAFHRVFGLNPKEYASHPGPIPLFISYGVKFRELRKDEIDMTNINNIFIQVVKKPERKVIIKRGIKAKDYFAYCDEVGDVWGTLLSIKTIYAEPVSLWLPEKYREQGTSTYVQGTEVPVDYEGEIPEGFDMITLPEADYLMFQGEPFDEELFCEAINALQEAMDRYLPSTIGYRWDDSNPRIQLEPRGDRGYIEMRAVTKL